MPWSSSRRAPLEHEQPEVGQAGRDRPPVDGDVLLGQVPAPRARHQGRRLLPQAVAAAVGALEADRALDGVDQVLLPAEHVLPGRGVGVLEVGHEHPGPGVEGVDQHLAVGRPGDLDPPVGDPLHRRHPPVALAHRRRLSEEVGQLAGVEAGLALAPPGQQRLPGRAQLPLQLGHQPQRLVAQDGPVPLPGRPVDLDPVGRCHRPALRRSGDILLSPHCVRGRGARSSRCRRRGGSGGGRGGGWGGPARTRPPRGPGGSRPRSRAGGAGRPGARWPAR